MLPCIVCHGDAFEPMRANRAYVRCTVCRSLRLAAQLAQDEATALFDDEYFNAGSNDGYADYEGDGAVHIANAVARLDDAEGRISHRGTFVDVGCAFGYTLDVAANRGWQTAGVELSPRARAATAAKGHRVFGRLAEIDGAATVVGFYQVLEHLVQPDVDLRVAAKLLESGGLLVIETWDADSGVARLLGRFWHQLSPPSVAHIWNRPGLTRLVRDAGFVDVQITRTSKRVNLATVFWLLAYKNTAGLGKLFERIARSGVARRHIRYGLGDLIQLHAIRP